MVLETILIGLFVVWILKIALSADIQYRSLVDLGAIETVQLNIADELLIWLSIKDEVTKEEVIEFIHNWEAKFD